LAAGVVVHQAVEELAGCGERAVLGCRSAAFKDTVEVERVETVARRKGEGESLIIPHLN